ncbi:MAG: hypothetical protein F6K17_38510, partial [Okeania sp. SIO3C4]|nr:hypothetical protein [Okeania sp. SIO3C4]
MTIYWTIVIALVIGDRSVEIDDLLDNSYCSGNWRSLCFAIIYVLWIYWTIVITLLIGDRSFEIDVLLNNS